MTFAEVANPLHWSTLTFVVLTLGTLLLHRLIPRSRHWYIRLLREAMLIVPAILVYFLVRGLVSARSDEAFANARGVIDLERSLRIFWEPELQEMILTSDLAVNVANWVYVWAHWPIIILVSIWLVLKHQAKYTVYRNAMFISGTLGLLIFAVFPVAPPRLMSSIDMIDTVSLRSGSYRVLQPPALTNPFAAMPSLHFGWNLVMGIALFQLATRWPVKLFGILTPIAMFLAVFLTANHYFIDAFVGGVLVLASLIFVGYLPRIRAYTSMMDNHPLLRFRRSDTERGVERRHNN